ncbi:MAG: hypothetical protein ABI481_03945, partial [Pyrinomonadaceae bacterium]
MTDESRSGSIIPIGFRFPHLPALDGGAFAGFSVSTSSGEPLRPSLCVAHGERKDRHVVGRQLRGDLDNIILMAIRKEPERRYSSVELFAGDIERHLQGMPVLARQDTLAYRTTKFVQRHTAAVAAGTGLVVALSAGLASTRRQARIAQRQRDKAENINQFLQKMLASADP